ncbi:MAG: DNA-binding winged helix-turn-helix (wHTH) protein, partial [Granulosicoccus sp.]
MKSIVPGIIDQHCYLLGDWLILPATSQIEKEGIRSHLQPMTMNVLVELLSNAPDIVPSQVLRNRVWGKIVVDETTIHRRINQIRTALGDNARKPRYIATVPKRGYRVVASVREVTNPAQGEAHNLANGIPFVGRVSTLARLEAKLRAVRETGEASYVFLTGPPGIGKTRTTEELAQRAKTEGWAVHAGWCDESGTTVPFWPWTRILRSIANEYGREKIAEFETEIILLHRIVPDIYADQPVPPSSTQLSQQDFRIKLGDAISRLLSRVAAQTPLLIMIDDLHIADEGSLAVLASVVRANQNDSLLIICAFRDHLIEQSAPISKVLAELSQPNAFDRIELQNLELDELKQANIFNLLSTDITDQIIERTDGNPLYTTMLVRSQVSSLNDGVSSKSELPKDLREMIAGQMVALPELANLLLITASCFGRQFSANLLSMVSEIDIAKLDTAMNECARVGLVDILPHGQYRFSHLLIQEVIYSETPVSRRQQIHATIADSIASISQTTPRSDLLMQAARHYQAADRPIDSARWTQKAFLTLVSKDDKEAVAVCLRALSSLSSESAVIREDSVKVAAWTLRTTVNALHRSGPSELPLSEVEALFDHATTTTSLLGDDNLLLTLLYTCFSDGLVYFRERERAIQVARDACYMVENHADEAVKLHALMTLIPRLDEAGRVAEAHALAQQSIKHPPTNFLVSILGQESWYPYPRILIFLARSSAQLGDPVSGIQHLQHATTLLNKNKQAVLPEDINLKRISETLMGAAQMAYECVIAGATCYYYLGETEKLAQCIGWDLTALRGDAPSYLQTAYRLDALSFHLTGDWASLAAMANNDSEASPECDTLTRAMILEAEVNLGQSDDIRADLENLLSDKTTANDPEALV